MAGASREPTLELAAASHGSARAAASDVQLETDACCCAAAGRTSTPGRRSRPTTSRALHRRHAAAAAGLAQFLRCSAPGALQGFAMFSVIEKSSGRWLGRLGPWQPEGWPGTEVGWTLRAATPGARGYATEARDGGDRLGIRQLGWSEVIHSIDPANVASQGAWPRKLGSRYLRDRAGCRRRTTTRSRSGGRRASSGVAPARTGGARMITVYGIPASGNCYKVQLLLEQLGREYPLGRGRQHRRRDAHAGIPGEESQRQGAAARARRRPHPGRIQRDPVLAGRRHAVPAGDAWQRAQALQLDVLRAVQPRALHRRRALHPRLDAGRIRRAAPNCRGCASAATRRWR